MLESFLNMFYTKCITNYLIIILVILIFLSCKYKKDNIEFLHRFDISKSLKTSFSESIDYCNTFHIAQNGAYESCMFEYIYNHSKEEYKLLMKIRKYCYETTDTEYDRRHCIDSVSYKQLTLPTTRRV